MTDYYRNVSAGAAEDRCAPAKLRALPRKLRKGLADDGRWLDDDKRAKLQAWVAERPRIATLVDYRARLARCSRARARRAGHARRLQAWCPRPRPAATASCRSFRPPQGLRAGTGAGLICSR